MMIHPQYDPVALSLGPVEVHWYGLMYLLAFAAAFGLAWYRSTKRDNWNTDMVSDLVFFGALGVILGGRVGYVLFYQFGEFLQNPAYLFKVWEGGMSFHGGMIGVLLGMLYFARKYKRPRFRCWTLSFLVCQRACYLVVLAITSMASYGAVSLTVATTGLPTSRKQLLLICSNCKPTLSYKS